MPVRATACLALCLLTGWGAALAAPGYSADIALDPDSGEIEIKGQLRLDGAAIDRLWLAPWTEVRRLGLNGVKLDYERRDRWLTFELPERTEWRIDFELGGRIPPREAGGAPLPGSSSGAGGIYLPAFDGWLPGLADARPADYRLNLSVPLPWRAVASAELGDEDDSGGRYRATFVAHATTEAPSLFAGPYEVAESQFGELRVRTWFHPGLEALSDAYRDAVAAYIERYSAQIGPYPYPDFHVVSAPLPVGLGFANLTYVGQRVLPLPFMRGRSLAHEVLHAWWGNGIAVDTTGGNWAEGLTTYQADYALALDAGAERARDMRIKWLRDFAALPPARDYPVREFRGKQHQASQVVGYNKTAFIFHMLAAEIGRGAFDAGLRELWRQQRFASAGWADLQAAFERSAGRELDWFFAQWLQRPGAPQLALGEHRVDAVADGYRLQIDITQQAPYYRLTLPLQLVTGDGVEQHRIAIDGASTRVELTSVAAPVGIRIDPDSHVFRRLGRDETPLILRDVTLNPDTATVIAAADAGYRELARQLAQGLLDTTTQWVNTPAEARGRPLLLIGDAAQLRRWRQSLGLVTAPSPVITDDTVAAWTARGPDGAPLLLVAAPDTSALRALVRLLPHYRGQSYLLLDGGRASERGVWPVESGFLSREF